MKEPVRRSQSDCTDIEDAAVGKFVFKLVWLPFAHTLNPRHSLRFGVAESIVATLRIKSIKFNDVRAWLKEFNRISA